MSTVFVTLSDESYFPKARRTLRELQVHGKWAGDIVLLAVDFTPPPMAGVRVRQISHLNIAPLFEQWNQHPIQAMPDNRHYGKVYQWDKLQVFTSYFKQWDRVVFLDAGLRVFDTVQPLLDLDWKGKLLAPDDADPYDNGSRFGRQLDLTANPAAAARLIEAYGERILGERYFNNCLFVFDTDLIGRYATVPAMEAMMVDYPIFLCNETGLMNLVFTFNANGCVWRALPQRVGSKYLFAWSENNYDERPDWGEFHMIKYSTTHT
jgi:hypothetical protein